MLKGYKKEVEENGTYFTATKEIKMNVEIEVYIGDVEAFEAGEVVEVELNVNEFNYYMATNTHYTETLSCKPCELDKHVKEYESKICAVYGA